jgi:PhnB protein
MIQLDPYLNFPGTTEEAFYFYKSIFGGEFKYVRRFSEEPNLPNKEKLSENDLNKIMHIAYQIGNNTLMATDALESLGHTLTYGNNISLSLFVDTREEADTIFNKLSEGGTIGTPMTDMLWGSYWGVCDDKFGIKWMINCVPKKD